jgi:hypothetical protein
MCSDTQIKPNVITEIIQSHKLSGDIRTQLTMPNSIPEITLSQDLLPGERCSY